jgi:hypothetical protein
VGETVLLRLRKFHEVINRTPTTSRPFVVDEVHRQDLDHPLDSSITTIVIRNEAIGVDVDPYGVGSLLYVPIPVPPPDGGVLHPYYTLVPPVAERIMAAIGGPLTGHEEDSSGKVAKKDMPDLIGVYVGGAQHTTGALHPAGRCMMNDHEEGLGSVTFCRACRYILIEHIDPERHWLVDRDYDQIYPL